MPAPANTESFFCLFLFFVTFFCLSVSIYSMRALFRYSSRIHFNRLGLCCAMMLFSFLSFEWEFVVVVSNINCTYTYRNRRAVYTIEAQCSRQRANRCTRDSKSLRVFPFKSNGQTNMAEWMIIFDSFFLSLSCFMYAKI